VSDNPNVSDEIHLNITGDRTKVKTIKPTLELPAVTQPVIIDGYTQPGSSKHSPATGAINPVSKIQLDGGAAGSNAEGLVMIQGISDVTDPQPRHQPLRPERNRLDEHGRFGRQPP
jgi:hypothetical protein